MSSDYMKALEAQRAEAAGMNVPVKMMGTKGDFHALADAAEGMSVLMQHAETTFGFLARVHADHDHDGHMGLEAITTLCCRALASAGEKEGDVVEKLVDRLRKAAEEKESAE